MEELTLLLVIVSFILPPVMIGVIGLLYSVPCLLCIARILFSVVGRSEMKNSRRRAADTEHVEIIVSKIGVYIIIAVCATYLAVSSYRNQRHLRRRTTMEIFFSSQGKVHGAELMIMAGTLVMFGSLEEFHQSDASRSSNEILLTSFFPYFLLSLVFGVQLRWSQDWSLCQFCVLIPSSNQTLSSQIYFAEWVVILPIKSKSAIKW